MQNNNNNQLCQLGLLHKGRWFSLGAHKYQFLSSLIRIWWIGQYVASIVSQVDNWIQSSWPHLKPLTTESWQSMFVWCGLVGFFFASLCASIDISYTNWKIVSVFYQWNEWVTIVLFLFVFFFVSLRLFDIRLKFPFNSAPFV